MKTCCCLYGCLKVLIDVGEIVVGHGVLRVDFYERDTLLAEERIVIAKKLEGLTKVMTREVLLIIVWGEAVFMCKRWMDASSASHNAVPDSYMLNAGIVKVFDKSAQSSGKTNLVGVKV